MIFAGIGTTLMLDGRPVLSEAVFAAVVVMVLVATLVAPPGLRWCLRGREVGCRPGRWAREGEDIVRGGLPLSPRRLFTPRHKAISGTT